MGSFWLDDETRHNHIIPSPSFLHGDRCPSASVCRSGESIGVPSFSSRGFGQAPRSCFLGRTAAASDFDTTGRCGVAWNGWHAGPLELDWWTRG